MRLHEPVPADAASRQVSRLLARGAPENLAARGVAHVLGLPILPVRTAIALTGRGTTHRPNARLREAEGARTAGVVRQVRDNELYFRSAYIVAASHRLNEALRGGATLQDAMRQERPFTRAHEQARRNRLNTSIKMQQLADLHGPLLGWYRDPLSNSETECFDADGHNFLAAEGTVIGFPGSVHPHCHCVAGPPHPDGGMVNDHVGLHRKHTTYRLKK